MAAHAILVRHRLAPESSELIVQPFRDAGFDVDHECSAEYRDPADDVVEDGLRNRSHDDE